MYHESTVVRNLKILDELHRKPSSLAEIANSAGYRVGPTQRSLHLLEGQGLVSRDDTGLYSFAGDYSTVKASLDLVTPWIDSISKSFYDIAKDTALIIHQKSWSEAKVEEVLFCGSTFTSDNPRDIDFVILHSGNRLEEFTPSRYADEGTENIYDLQPEHPSTRRLDAFTVLSRLGYQGENSTQRAVRYIGERIESLDAGSLSERKIQKEIEGGHWGNSEQELASHLDVYGVSNVFDVHVMHTGLLGDLDSLAEIPEYFRSYTIDNFVAARKEAIESCNDPTFWHRLLSTGKLYSIKDHDFNRTIEDRFPGALELFEISSTETTSDN